jgi:hypothetical protein
MQEEKQMTWLAIIWKVHSQTLEEFIFVVTNKFATGERKKGIGEIRELHDPRKFITVIREDQ